MRAQSSVFYAVFLFSWVHALNWFGSNGPPYSTWSHSDLRSWLEDHHIRVPSHFDLSQLHDLVAANWASTPASPTSVADQSRASLHAGRQWTQEQYTRAQHSFQDLKDSSFDNWDESRLRAFLLEHGVVAPSGPREQLILLAKQKHRSYTDAACHYSSLASDTVSSAYSGATDKLHTASATASSIVAQATHEIGRVFDDSKDYIYSTWDDARLRSWLEDQGVLEAEKASTHTDLLKLAHGYYRKAAGPVWQSWSDSYLREWLITHNILTPSDTASRSTLLAQMEKFYYSTSDKVWNTWSEIELKTWLVEHNLIESDAQKPRNELVKMVEDKYASACDSIWGAWSDSDIRRWLSEQGYVDDRTASQKNRDELVTLIDKTYNESARTVSYVVWPDARLRAYLREHGFSEAALPTSRPGLLQEIRIRWVMESNRSETMFAKLKGILNHSVRAVGDGMVRIYQLLSGSHHASEQDGCVRCWGSRESNDARGDADEKKDSV